MKRAAAAGGQAMPGGWQQYVPKESTAKLA